MIVLSCTCIVYSVVCNQFEHSKYSIDSWSMRPWCNLMLGCQLHNTY